VLEVLLNLYIKENFYSQLKQILKCKMAITNVL